MRNTPDSRTLDDVLTDEAPFGLKTSPHLQGPHAPVMHELTVDTVHGELSVVGQVPRDLHGVYLRNGPNARFAPNGSYHPFDGDGMVHAAQFDGGHVAYRNRWVRTPGLVEELEAGHATHSGIMTTLKGRTDLRLKDTANTDVVVHRGRAIATWYMSGAPHELDPITLATTTSAPWAGARKNFQLSAHCKVDDATGELLYFDYDVTPPYLRFGVVDKSGRVVHEVAIDLPGPRLPHDMAVTTRYAILHDLPLFHDHDALRAGRHKLEFHPELTTRFGVIPRRGAAASIKWFDFSPCFVYHVVNAWEDGDDVVMVGCRYLPARASDGSIDAQKTAKMIAMLHMNARLWRWRMNMKTGAACEEQLDDAHNVEFPSFDQKKLGTKTRFAYLVDHHPSSLRWTGLRKLDTDTGRVLGAWSDGAETTWYSEPWFAPRTGRSDDANGEDDGYVVVFAWNAETRKQELQVLDARDLSRGPVARVTLPQRVPSGFHATWATAPTLRAAGTWRDVGDR